MSVNQATRVFPQAACTFAYSVILSRIFSLSRAHKVIRVIYIEIDKTLDVSEIYLVNVYTSRWWATSIALIEGLSIHLIDAV